MQSFTLRADVVIDSLTRLVRKALGNRYLCIDFFLHFIGIKYLDECNAGIGLVGVSASSFVTSDIANTCTCDAGGFAAVATDTSAGAAGDVLAERATQPCCVSAFCRR